MNSAFCVADASALHEMCRCVDDTDHPALFDGLGKAIAKGRLGFPRGVADELLVIAREEPIWAWASGVKGQMNKFDGDIGNMRPFMGHVRDVGFPDGIQSIDGKEGCLADVGCLCLDLEEQGIDFVIATEDTGETPLRPTMEQIAAHAGWATMNAPDALNHLGLGALLFS